VITSVLVVSLGRLGDMYGRVKMYNLGFAIYTVFSLLLAITWLSGPAAAWYLILCGSGKASGRRSSWQLVGDPHRRLPRGPAGDGPRHQSGRGPAGSFIGLVLGGILGPIQWRLIFVVSVPIGLFGTVWAYKSSARCAAHATSASTGPATSPSPWV